MSTHDDVVDDLAALLSQDKAVFFDLIEQCQNQTASLTQENDDLKRLLAQAEAQVRDLDAQLLTLRRSWSHRLGFAILHFWKLPTLLARKLRAPTGDA